MTTSFLHNNPLAAKDAKIATLPRTRISPSELEKKFTAIRMHMNVSKFSFAVIIKLLLLRLHFFSILLEFSFSFWTSFVRKHESISLKSIRMVLGVDVVWCGVVAMCLALRLKGIWFETGHCYVI